jgi:hypothetical protein
MEHSFRIIRYNSYSYLYYNTYRMGLFGLLLMIVTILAVIGLGWKTFSSGVITGFERVVDVGTPVIKA